MKMLTSKKSILIILSIIISFALIVNIFLGMHPILDFFQYLANKNFIWLVPFLLVLFLGIWQYEINTKKKVSKERTEIFNATMRTIQDLLQNSASSMQLLILDMKDAGVHNEIIDRAGKNIDELKTVINTLASVDPLSIELKELNSKMSIIKMNE